MTWYLRADATYPKDFRKTAMTIFKRLFRVFAIIYCSHFDNIEQLGAAAHLNTSFKVRGEASIFLSLVQRSYGLPPSHCLKLISDDCSRIAVDTLKQISMWGYTP